MIRPVSAFAKRSKCKNTSLQSHLKNARTLFGLTEAIGVIANPAEMLRQLNESREMLSKAREDIKFASEKKRLPPKHTFSKLPGFHGREREIKAIDRILAGNPSFNLIFGATSVGKTALLRQVLTSDAYWVIHFDLRISGFADLRSLYMSLSIQFQQFFALMGHEEMEKHALGFKHARADLEEVEKNGYKASVADIASLMESLQSSMLAYWEFDPHKEEKDQKSKIDGEKKAKKESKLRLVDPTIEQDEDDEPGQDPDLEELTEHREQKKREAEEAKKKKFRKRGLVFFIDEAHKLPALVDDELSLKVFLDTLLVLTKQDRLCHVIHATSDSFYMHWLRQMNVGHHCQLLTIGDCPREEAFEYYMDQLVTTIPADLRPTISFDDLFEAFGGKKSHLTDYLSAWINSDGKLTPLTSPIFTQAYTLLQFHLTHTSFPTYSPLSTATRSPQAGNESSFDREQLIAVMRLLTQPPYSIPYFESCRRIGADAIDGMVKTRILELRWSRTVSPEEGYVETEWSKDGVEKPIILPMTRIIRKAMEIVLKEIADEVQTSDLAYVNAEPSKSNHVEKDPKHPGHETSVQQRTEETDDDVFEIPKATVTLNNADIASDIRTERANAVADDCATRKRGKTFLFPRRISIF